MIPKKKILRDTFRHLLVMGCTVGLLPCDISAYTPSPHFTQAPSLQDQAVKIPPDQLDSLVAPIALYPDSLLAQTLAASTYPLELIQLQQWLANNPGLKDQALADAVLKEPWDPRLLFQGSERAGPRLPARGNELRGGRGDDRGLRLGGRAGRVRCYRHQDIHG
jgi:Protein of unknown function (DUF3300)